MLSFELPICTIVRRDLTYKTVFMQHFVLLIWTASLNTAECAVSAHAQITKKCAVFDLFDLKANEVDHNCMCCLRKILNMFAVGPSDDGFAANALRDVMTFIFDLEVSLDRDRS